MKLGKRITAATGAALLAVSLSAGPAAANHDGYPKPNSILCNWWPFLC